MAGTAKSPLFTQQVVRAMRNLYPEELAERSWDNVGLLQENVDLGPRSQNTTVMLTNDLTLSVAEEAVRRDVSVIVSYHPFIFKGLKSITLADPQQRTVLLLAQNNIAVYSPHTAIDAAPGGMGDWLADILDGHSVDTHRTVIRPCPAPLPAGFAGSGYGRRVEFGHPVHIGRIVEAYAKGLGNLRHIMIAYPKTDPAVRSSRPSGRSASPPLPTGPPIAIRTVAVCAGSGADVFKECDADLYVTGEMTHHAALRLTMLGKVVLTVFHTNSERKFLQKRLLPQLQEGLRTVAGAKILISEDDDDPFEIWDVQNLPHWAFDRNRT
ncbi:GTP cyclohydrolase 1 type 2/Nif3 [Lasiosphaeris hirsuta]|uniref:GTP cyclohydrolase 1 type 2/Nif3 n=1 Tax=Lasiosphaeris hirsuta TaxID=260670 RepID=A0AA40E7K7_9PEZI|nr:GTP cyclohydrolase 1 type 2/Nif3 [Lasiosphaeris hirsuta]